MNSENFVSALSALDASLAAIDQEFHGPAREAIRAQMLGLGGLPAGQGGVSDALRGMARSGERG